MGYIVKKILLLIGAVVWTGNAIPAEPLTFRTHSLGTACYRASKMKVTYGRYITNNCPSLARDKKPDDDRDMPSAALGFRAFVGQLSVEWLALDGSALAEVLDLEKIFKGNRVLHNEDPSQIDPTLPLIAPSLLVVETNDRTLTIYMDVDIGLFSDEPGRLRRSSRNRQIAFQRNFEK